MNFLPVIEAKRDGKTLTAGEIRALVREFTAGRIPDYQMSAFLMAILFRGLSNEEVATLTLAMCDSGEGLKFPRDKRPLVDKHSTGGVGDKVSLPLTPLLACLGFRVPMISGRGLGITGGTLDKLESIPGLQTQLAPGRITQIVQKVGCVISGQTERMVPADRKLYALRDVTGTVPSIPLITASILSKKLAENLDALLLDVKFGGAAFMPSITEARTLARAMVALGRKCGLNTCAVLSDMSAPIGRAAGNWLEVKESVAVLNGERNAADLRLLVIECAARLLVQTRKTKSFVAARVQARDCLDSGAPRQKWDEMLKAQGADVDALNHKLARNHVASVIKELKTSRPGFVSRCDARVVGEIVRDLGGGRMKKDFAINHDVGVDHLAKPGEKVEAGGVLARIHADSKSAAATTVNRMAEAFTITSQPPAVGPLVRELVR